MRMPRTCRARWAGRSSRGRQQGSAVLLVLAFLFILELLVLSNTRTLDHLKSELRSLEKRQQEKFTPTPGETTNRVPARVPLKRAQP